jgi:lactase-phlorizin hydrolase
VSEAGVAYYNSLIDGLLASGIEPMATLYHWDLPQPLQDDGGGWLNSQIVQHFNDYATVCFDRFGDRVKLWLTLNEPYVVSWLGYGVGDFAPGIKSPDTGTYIATHNLIKAHAAAWHTYDEQFRAGQAGCISVTLDSDWKEPLDASNPSDVEAAERDMQFKLGWFAHPIYVNGDYPEVMKQKIAEKSAAEGRNESRLPVFTDDEKAYILGTHDFFGLNHYTTQLVTNYDHGTEWPSWDYDRDVQESVDPSWPQSGSDWLRVVPWGIRKLLVFIRDNYGNPEVYITENGVSDDADHQGSLQDQPRIDFYEGYINNVLKAIKTDGCNVAGYTAWSLMDNFEWGMGYGTTFGLHRVDFTDPARARTPKDSVNYYKQLIRDNGWPQQ